MMETWGRFETTEKVFTLINRKAFYQHILKKKASYLHIVGEKLPISF